MVIEELDHRLVLVVDADMFLPLVYRLLGGASLRRVCMRFIARILKLKFLLGFYESLFLYVHLNLKTDRERPRETREKRER